MRRKRKVSYKFTEKSHSRKGMLSLSLALISLIIGVAVVINSFQNTGDASVYVGSAGIFSILLSFSALFVGIKSLKEEERYKTFPVIGVLVSAIAFFSWLAIYILGFYML